MGADEKSRGSEAVAGQEWAAVGPRPLRPDKKTPADDADHRSLAAVRPGLREDLAAVLRESGSVRRRVRPRLVQAHAPRHGPGRALSRPARAEGDANLAGPDPRAGPSTG